MKNLKDIFSLKEKITIYIPSTKNVFESIDNSEYVEKAKILLSNLFGGATSIEVIGCYVSNSGVLIEEKITQVYAFGENIESNIGDILDFCSYLQIELSQESVALEVNNQLYFIDNVSRETIQNN